MDRAGNSVTPGPVVDAGSGLALAGAGRARAAFTEDRVAAARRWLACCRLCPHNCAVDRNAGERGRCQAGAEARVYRQRIEWGEEPELIPSQLFYLSGCNLRCAFCIGEADAAEADRGTPLAEPYFVSAVAWGARRRAKTLQWVGGEPAIHLAAILGVMAAVPQLPPTIWKSNFYCHPEVFDLLDGVIDIYVADFKFGEGTCAKRIAGADRYWQTLTENLCRVAARARLIIRHLLLPGHFECCYRPIVRWLSEALPQVPFSLRSGYLPCWHARDDRELGQRLPRDAYARAYELAVKSGLQVVE